MPSARRQGRIDASMIGMRASANDVGQYD